jgi:hypothetical protein
MPLKKLDQNRAVIFGTSAKKNQGYRGTWQMKKRERRNEGTLAS